MKVSIKTDIESYDQTTFTEWKEFMDDLVIKIQQSKFKTSKLAYKIPLSKVQLFKLKKSTIEKSEILLTDIMGEEFEIPIL